MLWNFKKFIDNSEAPITPGWFFLAHRLLDRNERGRLSVTGNDLTKVKRRPRDDICNCTLGGGSDGAEQ